MVEKMSEGNGEGVLKVFLGVAVLVLFGFMGWAVMEHYKDHDQHLRENYDQRMNDQRHDSDHERIMRGLGNHEDDARDREQRQQHQSYYCPECRRTVDRCQHYRRYDPYYNNGSYYCPDCRRMTRGCPHARHRNPYYGIEFSIR